MNQPTGSGESSGNRAPNATREARPDYEAFGDLSEPTGLGAALLRFLRSRGICDVALLGSLAGLGYVATQVIHCNDLTAPKALCSSLAMLFFAAMGAAGLCWGRASHATNVTNKKR